MFVVSLTKYLYLFIYTHNGDSTFQILLGDLKSFIEAGIETICNQLLERLDRCEHYYFQVTTSSVMSPQVLGGERFVQNYP